MLDSMWVGSGVFAGGAAVALGLAWARGVWLRRLSAVRASRRRGEAYGVLQKHGLSAHRYVADVGVDDNELRVALREFASSGHLVVNARHEIVGQVAIARDAAHPLPGPRISRRPKLRLVSSTSD